MRLYTDDLYLFCWNILIAAHLPNPPKSTYMDTIIRSPSITALTPIPVLKSQTPDIIKFKTTNLAVLFS